eukprot:m.930353 g.930353  ORF g.930353 m.930353 type:complete len:706 (-) comp23782_c0_seq50:2043-4160(-)
MILHTLPFAFHIQKARPQIALDEVASKEALRFTRVHVLHPLSTEADIVRHNLADLNLSKADVQLLSDAGAIYFHDAETFRQSSMCNMWTGRISQKCSKVITFGDGDGFAIIIYKTRVDFIIKFHAKRSHIKHSMMTFDHKQNFSGLESTELLDKIERKETLGKFKKGRGARNAEFQHQSAEFRSIMDRFKRGKHLNRQQTVGDGQALLQHAQRLSERHRKIEEISKELVDRLRSNTGNIVARKAGSTKSILNTGRKLMLQQEEVGSKQVESDTGENLHRSGSRVRRGVPVEHVAAGRPPDVIVLELDSVSKEFGMRHMPRMFNFLQKHSSDNTGTGWHGKNKMSVTWFDNHNPIGPNSIPNQLALMTGCEPFVNGGRSPPSDYEPQFYQTPTTTAPLPGKAGEAPTAGSRVPSGPWNDMYLLYCPPGAQAKPQATLRDAKATLARDTLGPWITKDQSKANEEVFYGTGTYFNTNASSWIWSAAKQRGYMTSLIEEFCYRDSMHVTQGIYFDLDAFIDYHNLGDFWCTMHFADRNSYMPCNFGRNQTRQGVSVEYLRQMWATFAHTPKLLYFNALPAHDYRPLPWSIINAEVADSVYFDFLSDTVLNSPLFNNTVVVLRSDHGLQDGHSNSEYSAQMYRGNASHYRENLECFAVFGVHRAVAFCIPTTLIQPLIICATLLHEDFYGIHWWRVQPCFTLSLEPLNAC